MKERQTEREQEREREQEKKGESWEEHHIGRKADEWRGGRKRWKKEGFYMVILLLIKGDVLYVRSKGFHLRIFG